MSAPTNVQTKFEDVYADAFRGHLQTLVEQVEAGLYSLKRYAFYLQKSSSHRKPAILELIKDTDHESGKKERIEQDRMSNYVLAYRHMQDIQYQLLHDELKFITAVTESVAEPLLAWHKTAERQKDALIKKEKDMSKELKDQQNKVVSLRKDAHKQYQSCQSAYRDYAKIDTAIKEATGGKSKYSSKDLLNAEKKLDKEKSKTEAVFSQLESLVETTNNIQSTYWNTDLPSLIQEWERLEAERLTMLGSHMYVYSHLQQGQVQPVVNASNMFSDDVKSLQGNSEMLEFASSVVRHHGPPQGLPVLQPLLPCPASALATMDAATLHELLAGDMTLAIAAREAPASVTKTVNFNAHHPIAMLRESTEKPVVDLNMDGLDDLDLPGLTLSSHADVITMPDAAAADIGTSDQGVAVADPVPAFAADPTPVTDTEAVPATAASGTDLPVAAASHDPIPPMPVTVPHSVGTVATSVHLSSHMTTPCATAEIVVGKYDFDGTDIEDLVFREEELIAVTSKLEGSEWWIGCKFDPTTGAVLDRGAFPCNYVEAVPEANFTALEQ